MKAIVIHNYGGPEVLKFEDFPDPVAGPGQVLVRVAATSINPIDNLRRAGVLKEMFPITFPGIVGVDLAGTVVKTGPGVEGFSAGDRVIAMAQQTYAQLCVVPANILVRLPEGLDLVDAAALPLVTTTGAQFIDEGTGVRAGQTVLVAGATGGVGRAAVFAAKERGAIVIAGVRNAQRREAESIGAARVVAIDDEDALAKLESVDAVATAVPGATAARLLGKVKAGGVFATVVGPPDNAGDFPGVRIVPVYSKPDPAVLLAMARAVRDRKFTIPIDRRIPLADAAAGQAAVQKGGIGKVLLLP